MELTIWADRWVSAAMMIGGKILTVLGLPLGFILCGMLVSAGLALAGWRRFGLLLIFSLTFMLWALATPEVSAVLTRNLEARYPVRALADVPKADVIIVLGGGLRPAVTGNPYPNLGEAGDRVLHAWRLYLAGKAPVILLSGGIIEAGDTRGSEADAMAELLVELGIPPSALILEDRSRDTAENARLSAKILAERRLHHGLLVTSALHMPRAMAEFRTEGVTVEPSAIDALAPYAGKGFPRNVLPDSESLDRSSRAVKEWLGLAKQAFDN